MNSESIRIMSNNQWAHNDNNAIWAARGEDCSAEVREQGFIEVYRKTQPDIIGFQEVTAKMLDLMTRGLNKDGAEPTYAALWGRDTPILYRQARFELVNSAFGIYPAACPGYEGCFNNDDTKSWNIALLRDKVTSKCVIVCTTHLWWKSDDPASKDYQPGSTAARVYQCSILVDEIERFRALSGADCPAVLVGDLNCPYDSEPIHYLQEHGFVHANDKAEWAYPYHGYHWCGDDGWEPYVPKPFEEAIDHVLIQGPMQVTRFDRYIDDAYLKLSDHFPAYIDAIIE